MLGGGIRFPLETESLERHFTVSALLSPGGSAADEIGRITPSGAFAEFPIPTANGGPWGITAGPDGNLWFTEAVATKIRRITTAGSAMEFA
jgi:streptogramin lyase